MPDPILALASLVGLFVYAAIGSVVGVGTVRLWQELFSVGDIKELAGLTTRHDDSWIGFGFAVVFWPSVLALEVAAGSVFALAIGPIFTARTIGKYLAQAQIKD